MSGPAILRDRSRTNERTECKVTRGSGFEPWLCSLLTTLWGKPLWAWSSHPQKQIGNEDFTKLPWSGRTKGVCQALEQRRSRQALRPTTWVQILTLQFKILLLPCQSYSASLSLRFLVCLRDDRTEPTVVGIEWHRRVQHFM